MEWAMLNHMLRAQGRADQNEPVDVLFNVHASSGEIPLGGVLPENLMMELTIWKKD